MSDGVRRYPFREWPFLVAVACMGLMLRGPVVAVAPIAGTISLDLGLSAVQIGLLTGLPVLCFALLTPFASFLASRTGPRAAVLIAIAGAGLGTVGGTSEEFGRYMKAEIVTWTKVAKDVGATVD